MDKQALEEIIKSLKEKFKREGIVTYDDVNALLSAGNVDPNEIDDILSALTGLGIEVKKPVQEHKSLGEKIDNEIKRLIKVGKAHGHLTYDEVGEKLAVECEANAEQMEEVLRILEENKIKVVRDEKPKVELNDKSRAYSINPEAISSALKELGKLCAECGVPYNPTADTIVRINESFKDSSTSLGDWESALAYVDKALEEAAEKLDEMRRIEGEALSIDLKMRLQSIFDTVCEVERHSRNSAEKYKEQLLHPFTVHKPNV